jgi:hypothetical protein
MADLTDSQIIGLVERILERHRNKTLNDQASKSVIVSSYAGGNPKTERFPGETGNDDTKRVCASYFHALPRPSDDCVEQPIGNDAVLNGRIIDVPAGSLTSGEFWTLPVNNPETTLATVGVTVSNQVVVSRVYIPCNLRFSSVEFDISTTDGSGFVGFALYSADGANLIFESGAKATSSGGVQSQPIGSTIEIFPGWYRYAWTSNSTTLRLRAHAFTTQMTAILNSTVAQRGSVAATGTNGVFPASVGAITPLNVAVPFIKLQG